MANVRTLKRRRLCDLYVTGTEVSVGDGQGEDVRGWGSKIPPMGRRVAVEEAAKPRPTTLASKKLPDDSPDKLRFVDQINDYVGEDRESLITFLMGPRLYELEVSAQERIAAEDKWSEKDYLTGLNQAWRDEMYDRYMADNEDKEAKRVFEELKAFTDEVDESLEEERESLKETFEVFSDEDLSTKALLQLIDTEADFVWMNELRRQELFFAVREPEDHKKRYFENREEVDMIEEEVFTQLLTAYLEVSVDTVEGKDSEETPSS